MKIGDQVIVTDPDGYVAEVRNKIKNDRVGEIVRLDEGDDYAYVRFPAVGRRKEFRHQFRLRFLRPADTLEQAAEVSPPTVPPPRRPAP